MDGRRTAFIFPGQGSQAPGMGRLIYEASAGARQVFELAEHATGLPVRHLCFDGTDEDLRATQHTQPALMTCSLALLAAARERGLVPSFVAGHSVGEYAALVAAGVLDPAAALRLVALRGRLMSEAGAARPGAMAAVFGLEVATIEAVCAQVAAQGHGVLEIANLNSPDQVVVSGDEPAIEAAASLAGAAGARRFTRLAVSAAFHSSLMAGPAATLGRAIDRVDLCDASVPVVTNVTATALTSAVELRSALRDQLASRVRWVEMVEALRAAGVEAFVELGPGTALAGLIRKIDRGLRVFSIADPAGLDRACEALLCRPATQAST